MEKKTSILVVDDDLDMIETLTDIFGALGHDTDGAGNGFRAIDMAKEKAYDMALIDIKMPGKNGIEVLEELKNISPSTNVIMMTAYSVENLVKKALEEGAICIVHKPLDIKRLESLIDECIRLSRTSTKQ